MEVRFDDVTGEPVTRDVRRRESSALERPTKTPEGFLRAEAFIAKPGVVSYTLSDGKTRREYIPPETIFDADSMASFSLMPVTLRHPPRLLTPDTVAAHQAGSVGTPTKAGDKLKASILVTRKDAIEAVEAGLRGTSCGYNARIVDRPGVLINDDGTQERFDAVQTKRYGNHLAICALGRAGEDIKIRMDSLDVVDPVIDEPTTEPATQEEPMANEATQLEVVTINGKNYQMPAAFAAQFRADSATDTRDSKISEQAGKIAALESQLKKAETERMDAAQVQAAADRRFAVMAKACTILGKQPKDFAGKSDLEIMREAVSKENPDVRMDAADEPFVRGAFEMIKRVNTPEALAKIMANDGKPPVTRMDAEDKRKQVFDARERMIKSQASAWMPASERPSSAAGA